MAYPTIAGVHRVVLKYRKTAYPEGAVNVIHILGGASSDEDVFDALVDAWETGMLSMVSDGATLYEVDVTALDGDVNTSTFSTDGNAKWNGSAGAQSIPQACALLKLTTGGGGRSGRGRIFLPWLGEAEQDAGTLADADRVASQGHWVNFANALVANDTPLVVASYLNSSYRQVLNIAMESRIATQRRRFHR